MSFQAGSLSGLRPQWWNLLITSGWHHINGIVQDCSNSNALAMELLQSCTKPWLSVLHCAIGMSVERSSFINCPLCWNTSVTGGFLAQIASIVGKVCSCHDIIMFYSSGAMIKRSCPLRASHCPACRTTLVATRFRVAVICPIIQVPHCIRVFFYFVWFVFINHIFQFHYELCTYRNILDIYLS